MKKIIKGHYKYKGYQIMKFKTYDNFAKIMHEGWRIFQLDKKHGYNPILSTNKLYQAKEQIDSWGEK